MKLPILVLGVFLWGNLNSFAAEDLLSSSQGLKHPLSEQIDGMKQSPYSPRLFELLKSWPPRFLPELSPSSPSIGIRPIRTPDRPNYIGSCKVLRIQAPLERVTALIDDFAHYTGLFSDLKEVKVLSQDSNLITTFWERPAPVFFVANPKYEQTYWVDKTSPSRVIYRYQLKKANQLNFSDGLIVLEKDKEGTRVSGVDFFDADWGLLRSLAESKIWKASLEGSVRGDFTLKIRAEHSDWTKKQVEQEVEKEMDRFPMDLEKMSFLDRLF